MYRITPAAIIGWSVAFLTLGYALYAPAADSMPEDPSLAGEPDTLHVIAEYEFDGPIADVGFGEP